MKSVREYYLEVLVNPHNFDSLDSFYLREKIFKLRELIKNRFQWDGFVIFMPNSYYAKQLLIYNHKGFIFSNKLVKTMNELVCLEVNEDNSDLVKFADSFIFSPISGISILGVKDLSMSPKFLGSKSILRADKSSYELVNDVAKYECGTPNVGLLMYLYDLYTNSDQR